MSTVNTYLIRYYDSCYMTFQADNVEHALEQFVDCEQLHTLNEIMLCVKVFPDTHEHSE